MRHATYLKVVSQELQNGRMVDVSTVTVCRCGRRFASEEQLQLHVLKPESKESLQVREPAPVSTDLLPPITLARPGATPPDPGEV
jgi:hypothetical protein